MKRYEEYEIEVMVHYQQKRERERERERERDQGHDIERVLSCHMFEKWTYC